MNSPSPRTERHELISQTFDRVQVRDLPHRRLRAIPPPRDDCSDIRGLRFLIFVADRFHVIRIINHHSLVPLPATPFPVHSLIRAKFSTAEQTDRTFNSTDIAHFLDSRVPN